MYGYIRAHRPELRLREDEYYRAVYCGLCSTMGKCTGQCSRMTLSYDFTFLALVRMALSGERPRLEKRRCAVHPLKKRSMAHPSPELEYCAVAAAILGYYKLLDDKNDEKGTKRLRARLLKPAFSSFRKKALRRGAHLGDLNALENKVIRSLDELAEIEKQKLPSVDIPADTFGRLMSDILSFGLTGTAHKLATDIGSHLGRWIYIVDAVDDFDEDVKKDRYNPFSCLYGAGEFTPERREAVKVALLNELCEAEGAFDLLDITDSPDLTGIIDNIRYIGLPSVADGVLFPAEKCKT
ncbi:MAG: hypothetical protein E7589_04960 [Ruminococcaceae bacterium]|nr:hypothetical protein [Oscillospiraceae bacterium]